MKEKSIKFYSESVPVRGTLARPDKLPRKAKVPGVVLAHGYGSFRDELTGFVELADKIAAEGMVSIRFDFRGCGESGEPGMILPHYEWVTDVLSCVSYLQSLRFVDHRRIGIVGMSVGGGTVCYAAGIDSRVKCTVALAPVADGAWWLQHLWESRRGKRAWKSFLDVLARDRIHRVYTGKSRKVPIGEVLAFDGEIKAARKKLLAEFPQFTTHVYLSSADSLIGFKPRQLVHLAAPRPIRFIHSKDDESVPLKHSRALYRAAGQVKDLKIIKGSPHCFWLSDQSEKVQQLTVEWLVKYLRK